MPDTLVFRVRFLTDAEEFTAFWSREQLERVIGQHEPSAIRAALYGNVKGEPVDVSKLADDVLLHIAPYVLMAGVVRNKGPFVRLRDNRDDDEPSWVAIRHEAITAIRVSLELRVVDDVEDDADEGGVNEVAMPLFGVLPGLTH
jgi:hypothetical protein